MRRDEFFRQCSGIYPKFPDPAVLDTYVQKLVQWKVSARKLDLLYEHITERCAYWPSLAEFCLVAEESGIKTKREIRQTQPWTAFDVKGVRYVSLKGSAPLESTNGHVIVADPVDYKPCSLEEARQAFREGWMSRPGASKARLNEFMRIVIQPSVKLSAVFESIGLTVKELAAGEQPEAEEDEESPF